MLILGKGYGFGPIAKLLFQHGIKTNQQIIRKFPHTNRYTASYQTHSISAVTSVFTTISKPADDSNVSFPTYKSILLSTNQEQFPNIPRLQPHNTKIRNNFQGWQPHLTMRTAHTWTKTSNDKLQKYEKGKTCLAKTPRLQTHHQITGFKP